MKAKAKIVPVTRVSREFAVSGRYVRDALVIIEQVMEEYRETLEALAR